MFRPGLVALLTTAAALAAGGFAAAAAVERVPATEVARPPTAIVPAGVTVVLTSPPDYSAQSPGTWAGPPYWASGRRELGGVATLDWQLEFDATSTSADTAALNAPSRGWRENQRGRLSVPHVRGAQTLGLLPGFFVLYEGPRPNDAQHEAVVAVPVGDALHLIVRFFMRSPAADSAGVNGQFLVNGSFLASTWNRGQIQIAFANVRIDGSLPPQLVSIRPAPKRAIRGRVVDLFRHPVAGAAVTVQRRTGTGWRGVRVVSTNAAGYYSTRGLRRGRYRAIAAYGGTTSTSASVTVR